MESCIVCAGKSNGESDCDVPSIRNNDIILYMKKLSYFIIQILWSLVLSTVIWFFTLKNASFDFYGNSDNSLSGLIFVIGSAIYLVLTIVQIVVGAIKVKDWHWWVILISLVIAGAVAFLGIYVVAYGTEFLNRTFGITF